MVILTDKKPADRRADKGHNPHEPKRDLEAVEGGSRNFACCGGSKKFAGTSVTVSYPCRKRASTGESYDG